MVNENMLFKLKLQNTVVERHNEVEATKMQFDRVLEGHSAVTIIAGDIGIGKTALIKTVLSDISKLNGTCVYGKFEQYQDKGPYIPIIQIVEHISNHMLTLPEEKLSEVRKKLIKELGKDSALITGIVPQAQWILNNARGFKDSDYQKLQRRLEKAFQIFITIAAKELYPLTIAVDDIQWADMPSWNIIKAINDPLNEQELYIILAYRNNLEKYRTRVKSLLDELFCNEYFLEINLESLTPEAINTILGEVFGGEHQEFDILARLIYRKTAGNPLYIKQMINLLLDNKGIYRDSQTKKWCLDIDKAKDVNLPDNIADIINSKIERLSPKVKELLEIASCIGSRFSLELLGKITKNKFEHLKKNLEVLCRAGLVVEVFEHPETDNTGEYEFFHDRIYQNVYENIDAARKEQLHFDIAMELLNHLDKIFVEENILSITAHLLKCKNVIKREGVGERLIVDLYFAGIKAKRSAAFEHAWKLLALGEELLGTSCWEKDYNNTLKIKLELTECEFICGHYEAARAHFDELQKHAANEVDLAEIKKRYMILNSYAGNPDRVIELGFQALRHLGFDIDTRMLPLQIAKEVFYGMILFRSSRLEYIKNAPIITDARVTNALEILTIMVASANMIEDKLFALIVLMIGNLSAKYGNSLYSPLGYAAYGLIMGPVMGNFKKAEKLKDISLNLAEIIDDDIFGTATYFCIGTFLAHWTSPAQESLNYLQKAFDSGIRSGDYLYCGYALIMMTEMKYLMGEPLNKLEKFLELHEKYVERINNDILMRSFATFKDHINMLASLDFSSDVRLIEDEEIEKLGTNEAMIYNLLKVQRMYLEGEVEEAYRLAQKSIKHLDSVKGSITQVDFVFYFLLVCLERSKNRRGRRFWQLVKATRKYLINLEKWAKLSPENHLGKHLLIKALIASLKDQQKDAARLYDEAIEHARSNDNLLLEALGNYLAADYYRCSPKIAKVYAQDAYQLFLQWGAIRMAERIGKLYRIDDDYTTREASCSQDADETPEDADILLGARLKDHQKELETLNLEDAYIYFLDTVCEEVGADCCAILLEEGDLLKVRYFRQNGQPAVKYPVGIDPERFEYLPKKIIRYAGRTYEEISIEAKPLDGPFAGDEYIKQRPSISIICLPLKYNDIFTGIIYLDSREDNRFNTTAAEHIKRQSFYLVAKEALEGKTSGNGKIFMNHTMNEQLTEREMDVLHYISEGMTNKEIGEKLGISASTVKTHILNLYGKLEVNSRVQAVIKAKALKLI